MRRVERHAAGWAAFAIGLIPALWMATLGPAAATHTDAIGQLLPHATYRIWDLNATIPEFGFDANMTVSDPNGATLHVSSAGAPHTNVTVMENTFCSNQACGVTYWNPATNDFKCYGYSSGAMTGVDVNISTPVLTSPDGTAYPLGSTWLFKSSGRTVGSLPPSGCGSSCSLTVQFPGTNTFRSWEAGNASSGAVDQASGLIWVTRTGFISRFDPATDILTSWPIGGVPRDIVVDGAGVAYATVGPLGTAGDDIVRIDPAAAAGAQVTRWGVPAVGHAAPSLQGSFAAFSQNPNGIALDSAGNVWFAETISDEIGRLDTVTDTFIEYLKIDPVTGANAIAEPQNVAASGSGAKLQGFFSEGDGDATGIVTPDEAAGTSQEVVTTPVAPTMPVIFSVDEPLVHIENIRLPSEKTIVPTVHPVDGLDGVLFTPPGPTTAAGEVIPGILRFPLPTATDIRAVGMTEVLIANTVFGSLIGTAGSFPRPPTEEKVFELTSKAIIAKPPQGGRMYGGGTVDGNRDVSLGFEVHCNVSQQPNMVQVNWGQRSDNPQRFHLEVFSTVSCIDDPLIDEGRPVAGFDTFEGEGLGRYNGVSGASIEWKFTDRGEPGRNDTVDILIVEAGGTTVLDVSGSIRQGDIQAIPTAGAGNSNNGAPLDASTLGKTLWVSSGEGYTAVVPWLDSTDPDTIMCSP